MNPPGYVRLAAEVTCYACRTSLLGGPLVLCGCGCRLPLHPLCYDILKTRQDHCPICGKLWNSPSSDQSIVSMPFTEAIVERPLTQTECVPACSTRWMLYSLAVFVLLLGALFLFFYYVIR